MVRFDWTGVTVGHWRGLAYAGSDKSRHLLVRCVSRCGVESNERAAVLAAGGIQTCEACRNGCHPPSLSRVVPERKLQCHRSSWGELKVDIKSNLKSEAIPEWDRHGLPDLEAFISRSGLGLDFGWRVRVRDCHKSKPGEVERSVQIRQYRDAVRQVELKVRPKGSGYWFEVDLSTGRTDVAWVKIREALLLAESSAAVPGNSPAPPVAAKPPPPPPLSPPPSEKILGGMSVDALIRMRAGFDTLITVGRDVEECGVMKRDALAVLASKESEAHPLRDRAEAAASVASRAISAADDAKERADRLNQELKEAVSVRDRLVSESEALIVARDRAFSAYAPAREAVEAAKKHLAEVEALEAERLKTLAAAGDMAVILAALQKLGASSGG